MEQVGLYQTPEYIADLLLKILQIHHPQSICIIGFDEKLFWQKALNEYKFKASDIYLYSNNKEDKYPVNSNVNSNYLNEPFVDKNEELMRFGGVVGILPFGAKNQTNIETLKKDSHNRFKRGIPNQMRGEYTYISHALETIEQYGKAVLVCPTSMLSRLGKEQTFRKNLIEENIIESIITLPDKCLSTVTISVSIVIFSKSKPDKNILFIDASNDFETSKSRNILRPQDIDKICDCYKNAKVIEGYSEKVSFDKLETNEFSMNVQLYIKRKGLNQEIDLIALEKNVFELEAKILTIKNELTKNLKELGVIAQKQ